MPKASNKKKVCQFGGKCYRKNPQHLKEYSHSKSDTEEKEEVDEPPTKKAKTAALDIENGSSATKEFTEKGFRTHEEVADIIRKHYGCEMPKDFYLFWEFCKDMNESDPLAALSAFQLQLVGVYDIFLKHYETIDDDILVHWRYYYDPPEVMTVLRADDKTQLHLGYFRDDAKELPCFVVSNEAATGCTLTPRGENLFNAVSWYLEQQSKRSDDSELHDCLDKLKEFAKKETLSLEQKTANMKMRDKKVNSKLFHGCGMVVPVDENDVGYRDLNMTNAQLKDILKQIVSAKTDSAKQSAMDELEQTMTYVQFANDECDYGMGMELGLDLFCDGSPLLHKSVLRLLPLAYDLLGRNVYETIIRKHLESREKDVDKLSRLAAS